MRHGSMMVLGLALLAEGNDAAADKALLRAAASTNPGFLQLMANRVLQYNCWQLSLGLLHRCIELAPDNADRWLDLARLQAQLSQTGDALKSVEEALRLAPEHPAARALQQHLKANLGGAAEKLSHLLAQFERSNDAERVRLASSAAMASLYCDHLSAEEVVALHKLLMQPLEDRTTAPLMDKRLSRAGRRLRIGYVSGDLHHQHPVNLLMLPILQHHDHERVEIVIYHSGQMIDRCTHAAKACADKWHDVANWTDEVLYETIRNDGIDILVDLAGHTGTHRLDVFLRRAAPVQVSFMGYPHSTGLSAMDWMIADNIVAPPEHQHLFSERLARLPVVFCWAAVDDYPIPPARAHDAPVVFGSFNNIDKVSMRTIQLWARVLTAVPDSRLLLKSAALADAPVRERLIVQFAKEGITADRLEFRGPSGLSDMMAEYGDVDIALDSTPYNGGATTMQALWMGVPVISLRGDNFVGRMGASLLTAMGRQHWVAEDADMYVQNARDLVAEVSKLRRERSVIREDLQRSPLGDIKAYTRALEGIYERIWDEEI